MFGEQKESMCGWVHMSIDREEWGKVKSEEELGPERFYRLHLGLEFYFE